MVDAQVLRLEDPRGFIDDWTALYKAAENTGFFQSPAWMWAWLADPPKDAALFRVEIRDDDKLLLLGVIGALPKRKQTLIQFTEARLHEYGDPDRDAVYVEYNDFLIARDNGASLRLAALSAIMDAFPNTDTFVFRNATPAMAQALEEVAVKQGMRLRILNSQPVYQCDLAAAREAGEFLATLSASLQSKIRRSMRRYEERGALTCRIAQSVAEQAAAWEKLVKLHQAAWEARGAAGVFANKQLVAFHRRLRAAAPEKYCLFEVRAGDQTVGVLYNFMHEDRVMNYQSGFLYEDDNQLAPGFTCHAIACQHYLEQGYDVYDMLAGEADYKRRLGEEHTILTSVAIDRPTWRASARALLKRLAPARRA